MPFQRLYKPSISPRVNIRAGQFFGILVRSADAVFRGVAKTGARVPFFLPPISLVSIPSSALPPRIFRLGRPPRPHVTHV